MKEIKDSLMNLWLETFEKGILPNEAMARINFIIDSIKNPNYVAYEVSNKINMELHQLVKINDDNNIIDDNYMVYKILEKDGKTKVTLIKYSYYEYLSRQTI